MKVRDYIEEVASNNDSVVVMLSSEFDSAIIGIQNKDDFTRAVYSETKMIQALMDQMDMDRDDALDFYGFNIENAYVGEGSPIFIDDTVLEFAG